MTFVRNRLNLVLAAMVGLAGAARADPILDITTPGQQTFNVMTTGYYTIFGLGAHGGAGNGLAGGNGAQVSGLFFLSQGDVLHLYVGGQGGSRGAAGAGGGGGGTFVVLASGIGAGSPLLVAGGGGGGGFRFVGNDASLTVNGTDGNGIGGAAGGVAGNGGLGGSPSGNFTGGGGGGGGGFLTAGGNAVGLSVVAGGGGGGYPNLSGGTRSPSALGGEGGAGGGGGGGSAGGGGGGGYSGGGGGAGSSSLNSGSGGGGGSYISAMATDTGFSVSSGGTNGRITITLTQTVIATPEPSSLAVFGLGLTALLVSRRRQR